MDLTEEIAERRGVSPAFAHLVIKRMREGVSEEVAVTEIEGFATDLREQLQEVRSQAIHLAEVLERLEGRFQ